MFEDVGIDHKCDHILTTLPEEDMTCFVINTYGEWTNGITHSTTPVFVNTEATVDGVLRVSP